MKVLYSRDAQLYFNQLSEILYEKNYFSYKESSREYVRSLILKMESTIHLRPKHKAPAHFSKYGKDLYYITCPKSKRTTWYFFFTYHPDSDIYYIRHITNNHVSAHLIP